MGEGVEKDLGQPKAECDPTIEHTHCVYPTFIYVVYQTSLKCKLEKKRNQFVDLGKRFRAFEGAI